MESWTTWYTCSATLHRTGHAKALLLWKAAIVMLQEIRIPRSSKFRVQGNFRRKNLEYECYIAAGSEIDLVADTDSDQVPSDGYNDRRAHITVVTFLHTECQLVTKPKESHAWVWSRTKSCLHGYRAQNTLAQLQSITRTVQV